MIASASACALSDMASSPEHPPAWAIRPHRRKVDWPVPTMQLVTEEGKIGTVRRFVAYLPFSRCAFNRWPRGTRLSVPHRQYWWPQTHARMVPKASNTHLALLLRLVVSHSGSRRQEHSHDTDSRIQHRRDPGLCNRVQHDSLWAERAVGCAGQPFSKTELYRWMRALTHRAGIVRSGWQMSTKGLSSLRNCSTDTNARLRGPPPWVARLT